MRGYINKSWKILLLATMICTLLSTLTLDPVTAPEETYDKFGPSLNQILIKIYTAGRDAEFGALTSGQIDIIDWPLDFTTYQTLLGQPDVYVTYPLTMYDMYNIEMNNMKWPLTDVYVRRAVAHLVNKEYFYTQQLKTFSGSLMDTPIASEWTQWYNSATAKYPYNTTRAAEILTGAGYYDDDADGVREYHNTTGRFELPTMSFYIREDDPDRRTMGEWLSYEMEAIGLPVNGIIAPKQTCWTAVMTYPYNYYFYTGGWGPWRDPDYLYDMYHSKFGKDWYNAHRDWCNNYVFFDNSTFDAVAEQLKFAPDIATAQVAAMEAQEILMDQVPMIPGWHSAGALAHRKNYSHWSGENRYWDQPWTGMVNTKIISGMSTSGLNGRWSFLNAHPSGWDKGGTIRYGFMATFDVANPVHADFYWDWEVLDKIYDYLILADPIGGEDIPWMAKSWEVGTWDKSGTTCSKFTFHLFKNILWHDNQPFTAADVKFTCEYMKAAYSPLFYPYVLDIDHIDIPVDDPYTVTIYYNVLSVWGLHWLGGFPMIPKHIWEPIPPGNSRTGGEYETTNKLTGSGPYKLVSKTSTEIVLVENPTYFRKVVRPDFYKTGSPIPTHDGDVDIDDFGIAVGHFLDEYPWPHAVDQWADVNKDLIIDLDDIMEIGVRYLKTEYYPYSNGYPNYYAP